MDDTQVIYIRLLHVIPNLRHIGTYAKLSAPGFMDLHVDILHKTGNVRGISLARNYKAGGDVIPDPDMGKSLSISLVYLPKQRHTRIRMCIGWPMMSDQKRN